MSITKLFMDRGPGGLLGKKVLIKKTYKAKNESYFIAQKGNFERKHVLAVVLHLYHAEAWDDVFKGRLLALFGEYKFDLYLTMPEKNLTHLASIQKTFPDVSVFVVPNKGRDVLPFIKAAAVLYDLGYRSVLKLHSKKSEHRETSNTADAGGGYEWLTNTLDALIPSNTALLKRLVTKIKAKNTGMIGPLDYHYPLRMYLGHNRKAIQRIIGDIDDSFFNKDLSDRVEGLGFFGGTMFWINLDTITDILRLSKRSFEDELGQTDGTTAHALERVFCMLQYIQGKEVFGVTERKITKATKSNLVIPDWYYNDVAAGRPPVSIVVPVYADWSSLSKNIMSLKGVVGDLEDVSVHYVNDCGPDADVLEQKILAATAGLTNFHYHRNANNLGFVKTCNRAVYQLVDQRSDVLLLNSDTKVTRGFIGAMKDVLYSEPKIGAVTSRSNNATIWSVPMTGRLANQRLASYAIYLLMRRTLPAKYISPTIHGFCVLIRREVVNKFGLFDEVYGKGYGEENDFAMRLYQAGWSCAVANKSFVFHYESRSFGAEVRNAQIDKNERILLKRYPEYRRLVQEYWDSIKEPLK